jgi:hypothetical protein
MTLFQRARRGILGDLGAVGLGEAGAGRGTAARFSHEETDVNQVTAGDRSQKVGQRAHASSSANNPVECWPSRTNRAGIGGKSAFESLRTDVDPGEGLPPRTEPLVVVRQNIRDQTGRHVWARPG